MKNIWSRGLILNQRLDNPLNLFPRYSLNKLLVYLLRKHLSGKGWYKGARSPHRHHPPQLEELLNLLPDLIILSGPLLL